MNRVNDWLWIGDANDGCNVPALKAEGITHVFNATQEPDGWPPEFAAQTPYLQLDQPDGTPIPIDKLDRFAAWFGVQTYCRQPCLLIHCGAGVSRASTFGALAMMLYDGLAWSVALEAIRKVRPIIGPNPVLVQSLQEWWRHQGGRPEALA